MAPWVLAIDFGTSYTVAAARVEGRAPEIVDIAGERRMPSVVLVEPGGDTLVGRTAEDLSATHPGSTLRALKNRLGDQIPTILGGRPHQVVTLVAALLREVFDQVIVQMGTPPAEVHLTHPAAWNQPRITRLIEAAAKAGLPKPLLVPEPVAAALSYAADVGLAPGMPIVIYDLGGGTFDSAVVTAHDGGFNVIGRPTGDQHIGGELFDELLVNHIGDNLEPSAWEAIQVGDDPLWRQIGAALRNEARKAKESLSTHSYANVLIPLPAGLQQVRITRDELTEMIRPYIDETVVTLQRCVQDAGVRPQDLAGISLVGGSSRSPIVEELVRAAFPMVPISRRGDPKATVAAGATLAEPPSPSAPGLWRSQATQEASPGTAPQRVRLAPPPLSDPPVAPTSSPPTPPTTPPPTSSPPSPPPPTPSSPTPSSPTPSTPTPSTPTPSTPTPSTPTPSTPTPSTPARSAPPPATPPPSPTRPIPAVPAAASQESPVTTTVALSGSLQPEPDASRRRLRLALLIVLPILIIAAVVGVLATRSDDNGPSSDSADTTLVSGAPVVPSDATGLEESSLPSVSSSDTTAADTDPANTDPANTNPVDTDPTETDSGDTGSGTTSPGGNGATVVGNELASAEGHSGEIVSAEFSPDSQSLVTAGVDGRAIVWKGASQRTALIGHTGEVYSAVFSPDGKTIATTGEDGTVRLWDAESGESLFVFTGHRGIVYQVRFSPDGGSLLSAGADTTVRLWDIASRRQSASFLGSTEAAYFAEFSSNGEMVVAGGQDDIVRVWSVFAADDPLVLEGHYADVQVGMFSPDGTLIATGSDDETTKIWSTESGTLVQDLGFIEGGVWSTTFSHDGVRVMSSGTDYTAAIWDVATGILLGDLTGHTNIVYSAQFSPDDNMVVTASADGTATLYDVSLGTPVDTKIAILSNGDSPILGAVFSPNGEFVATFSADGRVTLWAAR